MSSTQRTSPAGSSDTSGAWGLLFAGVGSIIGSGWLFGALEASQLAGPAAVVWLAGSWILPWHGALALVSYLGSYGGEAAHDIGRGARVLVIAAISVVVYVAAYRLRLPGRRVKELIDDAAATA
jgi:hypothetical protein